MTPPPKNTLNLDPGRIVAQASATLEELPKGSTPVVSDVRTYSLSSSYDPGPTPATVGLRVGFVSSKNFQSITLQVECLVPSQPTLDHMAMRNKVASDFAFVVLNEHTGRLNQLAKSIGLGKHAPTVVLDDALEAVVEEVGSIMRLKRKK